MRDTIVACELCDCYFPAEHMNAFVWRRGGIEPVDLCGKSPWSGVRCVCTRCVKTIASTLKGPNHASDQTQTTAAAPG